MQPCAIDTTPVRLQRGFWCIAGHTVQQNTSKGTKIAITVCPDPWPGFHVHSNLISFLEEQYHPVGAIISDVGGSWMLCGANNNLAVLIQK